MLINGFDIEFCLEAMDRVMDGGLEPKTFHLDQGSQFTATAFVGRLMGEEIEISWTHLGSLLSCARPIPTVMQAPMGPGSKSIVP
jgi:hypothetical protein